MKVRRWFSTRSLHTV